MKMMALLSLTLLLTGTAGAADRDIKLSGCLVRGEGDASGYLLTNFSNEPGWLNPEHDKVAPSAVGTTGGFSPIFYWLDGSSDLRDHVGHRVEVQGELRGDLRDGEIHVDRKDNWTEVRIKSAGHEMKARVPRTWKSDPEGKGNVLIRRVEVDKVKMLDANCN